MADENEETTAEIEIYAVVDRDGDYEVGKDEDEALERYGDNIGAYASRHTIKMSLTVPLPKPIEVSATLPEKEDGGYSLEIKQS